MSGEMHTLPFTEMSACWWVGGGLYLHDYLRQCVWRRNRKGWDLPYEDAG